MWTILSAIVPVALIFIGLLILLAVVSLNRARDSRYPRRSPLTRDMLRPPGHSLRQKIKDMDVEIDTCFVMFLLIPVAVYALHISQSYFGGTEESWLRTAITLTMAGGFVVVVGWRLLRLLQKRKRFALGLEGELATGEELNQLMLDGCHVFHDVPFQYGNIDHVVASHSGVYSINTKLLGKPKESGESEIVIDHQRNVIRFPDREVTIPTGQLEGEAKWLSEQLTKSVGEPIKVEPMLALPGWYVKDRIGRGSVFVFNPRKPQKFFLQNRQVLSPKQIEQIAHQLEQLCRDVERKYGEKKGW